MREWIHIDLIDTHDMESILAAGDDDTESSLSTNAPTGEPAVPPPQILEKILEYLDPAAPLILLLNWLVDDLPLGDTTPLTESSRSAILRKKSNGGQAARKLNYSLSMRQN
jgi:hypothetical protein